MLNGQVIGAVVTAAGTGTRMGSETAKQFLELNGKPILVHALAPFQDSVLVDEIVVTTRSEDCLTVRNLVAAHGISKSTIIVGGGPRRQDSVWNGVKALKACRPDIVLVHDAVRPFVRQELIRSVVVAAFKDGAAIPAVRAKDTTKLSDGDGFVGCTLDRELVRLVQTPQAFRFELLYQAFESAIEHGYLGSDEAMLVERLGKKVRIVEGSWENIKITVPEDIAVAEMILSTFFR